MLIGLRELQHHKKPSRLEAWTYGFAKIVLEHPWLYRTGLAFARLMTRGKGRWLDKLPGAGDGWTKIVNVRSGKLMAVDGASQANSAQVTQWNDNGTSDHLWRLV